MPNELESPMSFRSVSETLLQFAKGLDSAAIPKLTFKFEYEPADLPALSVGWKASVTLVGLKDINEESGIQTNSYEKSWSGEGDSPEEASAEMLKNLRASLDFETNQKMRELQSLQDALASMRNSVDLASLWQTTAREHPFETEESLEALLPPPPRP